MSALGDEFLTTRELAELLRIKERKVYDLAASGEIPCSRATGKLLFPRRAIDAWIAEASSGPSPAPHRPEVFLGSHDPLLEWSLRESRCGLATYFDGSVDGLDRFAAGEGVATGLHLADGDDEWNVPAVRARCGDQQAVLVEFAWRERGLIVAESELAAMRGPADLRGRRVVPRPHTAGGQRLLERMLDQAGVAPSSVEFTAVAQSERDAAIAVLEGEAEAAFGLRGLADQYRLAFVPVLRERFDLLVDRRAWFEPPLQRLLRFCGSEAFADRAAGLHGYDVGGLGRVHYNGP
jgi:excisionase family DNA binding protein